MADIARFDRALDHIEAHPERHEQGVWVRKSVNCGTAGCIAGWVVVQEYPDAEFVQDSHDHGGSYSSVALPGGVESIEQVARGLLGIDTGQGDALFASGNTLDELRAMRDLLAERPDVPGYNLADLRATDEYNDEYYDGDDGE